MRDKPSNLDKAKVSVAFRTTVTSIREFRSRLHFLCSSSIAIERNKEVIFDPPAIPCSNRFEEVQRRTESMNSSQIKQSQFQAEVEAKAPSVRRSD